MKVSQGNSSDIPNQLDIVDLDENVSWFTTNSGKATRTYNMKRQEGEVSSFDIDSARI